MKKKRTKILFVINKLTYGGAEKMFTFVANKLSESDRYEITVYSFESNTYYYKLSEGINYIGETHVAKRKILRRFVQLFQIMRTIKREKADIVISFLHNPNILSIFASKIMRTPVIISERGDPYNWHFYLKRVKTLIYGYADGIVFQTEGAKCFFPIKIQKNSCVIPNPVLPLEQKFESSYNATSKEICFIARFENKQKRQDIMLKAFKIVLEKYPDMILRFYGDGPDEPFIRDLAHSMGIINNIKFMGVSKNPVRDIANSRIFVLTSDYEGIPNALIEAMSIGLPVISTDCSPGGARMLIDDGVNGMIVPKGDYKAIADKMIRYIEDPELAKEHGINARKIKEKFSPDKIIYQWESYICKVLGR